MRVRGRVRVWVGVRVRARVRVNLDGGDILLERGIVEGVVPLLVTW